MTLAEMAAVGTTAQGAAAVPLALRGPTRRVPHLIEAASCPIPQTVLRATEDRCEAARG